MNEKEKKKNHYKDFLHY